MSIALPKSDEILSEALHRTLTALVARFRSEESLGKVLSITGSGVNKIKNGANWPGFRLGWRIARLASCFDIDLLPDVMSAEGKRTLPVPMHFEGLDGQIEGEVAESAEHNGFVRHLFNLGHLDEAERHACSLIRAGYQMLAKINARRQDGVRTTGDGVPQRAVMSLP